MKKCPHCAEEVQDEAVFCKHCKKDILLQQKFTPPSVEGKSLGNNPLSKRTLLAIVAFIVLLSLYYVYTVKHPEAPAIAPTSQSSLPVIAVAPTLDTIGNMPYNIVSRNDHSIKAINGKLSDNTTQQVQQAPLNKRFVYRVIVAPGLTESQIKATINQLIIDETVKDGDIDEIGIFMFDDKKDSQSIYTVAKADWAPQGKWGNTTPQVASSNDRGNYQVRYQFAK